MQISKVDETYCVLRYNIWQVEHTSKTILKHVVYVCCILGCSLCILLLIVFLCFYNLYYIHFVCVLSQIIDFYGNV